MAVVVRRLESSAVGVFFDCAAEVTLDGRTERLTFRRYGDHPRLADRLDSFDPFAVALLVPAMIRGEPLVIEGAIDDWLLGALQGPVQALLRSIAPTWRRVTIEADPRPAPPTTDWSQGAAAAMSGGIDSLHLARHRLLGPATPEMLRVRLLVHHHVGAHGEDDAVFAEQCDHARRIADRLKLPLVGARCALRKAYRGMKFMHSVTMRNVAASLTLDHLFSVFHYASTETLAARPAFDRSNGLSTIDPTLLPLFNTTRAVWLPFGGDATRLRRPSASIAHRSTRRPAGSAWTSPPCPPGRRQEAPGASLVAETASTAASARRLSGGSMETLLQKPARGRHTVLPCPFFEGACPHVSQSQHLWPSLVRPPE